jgi:hypothetical protein
MAGTGRPPFQREHPYALPRRLYEAEDKPVTPAKKTARDPSFARTLIATTTTSPA